MSEKTLVPTSRLMSGPGLPVNLREKRMERVCEEDLRELVYGRHSDWGEAYRHEAKVQGRRLKSNGAAYLSMVLGKWCADLFPGHWRNVVVRGVVLHRLPVAVLQLSSAFQAAAVGYSNAQLQRGFDQVDGTRDLRLARTTPRRRKKGAPSSPGPGRQWAFRDRQLVRLKALNGQKTWTEEWVDPRTGETRKATHVAVDVRGIFVPTEEGLNAVFRRRAIANRRKWKAAGRPMWRSKALEDLRRRLKHVARVIRRRLGRLLAPVENLGRKPEAPQRPRPSRRKNEIPPTGGPSPPVDLCSRLGGRGAGEEPRLVAKSPGENRGGVLRTVLKEHWPEARVSRATGAQERALKGKGTPPPPLPNARHMPTSAV